MGQDKKRTSVLVGEDESALCLESVWPNAGMDARGRSSNTLQLRRLQEMCTSLPHGACQA